MSRQLADTYLSYNSLVDGISKHNKDKVIHADLKETEFDDVVLGAVAPESQRLKNSITIHSQKLCDYTEYEIAVEAKPVQTDQLLRVSFWDEVNTAIAESRPISERKIWTGVCSNTYWNKVRDELEWKMAYILCPLMSYSKANKLGLHLGQKAMLEILNASPYQGNGEHKTFNSKIAQLQLQAYQALQDRMFGKAVQRLQTHNTNENVDKKESIEELQKEIALLEGKKASMPVTVEVVGE
jgi:hypothetical protein